MKQAGNFNKITTYLILHIRKTYEHGGNIADAVENQEPFNFDPSAPRLQISSTIETETTSPQDNLEIKCQNDQYEIEYEAAPQVKKSLLHKPGEGICIPIWTMHNRPTA